jgi:hypothetical protein
MKIMMMRIKKQAITITGYHFLIIALSISMSLMAPTMGMAEELVTYEGTIQGLNCVHFQQKCPEEDLDMYIALEHDFVLLLVDGRHFVLPNLDRGIKTRYLTKDVRIRGKQKGTTLWVENLEVKEGQRYRLIWNFQEQKKMEQAP